MSLLCDSSNRCHAMIHQNADAMVLASARLRGIPPLDVHHFEYYQGGECLSNAHWLGSWRQHLMTNYGLRQNHRKIIGKTKKSAFCVPYSVPGFSIRSRLAENKMADNNQNLRQLSNVIYSHCSLSPHNTFD
jgi:hypothetical protein